MSKASLSRFSALALESSDEENANQDRQAKKTTSKTNQGSKKKSTAEQKKREKAELVALAFGGKKSKPAKKQQNLQPVGENGFEDWKKKDEEFVEESYKSQLEQALLASKIAFEEDKTRSEDTSEGKKENKKKKKPAKMTIGEFQSAPGSQVESTVPSDPIPKTNGSPEIDDLFERVHQEAKNIVKKEATRVKEVLDEPLIAGTARIAHLEEEVRLRDEEVKLLKGEVVRLKEELTSSKSKIKKLCTILGQSETREKAEILAQNLKMEREKEELVQEVTRVSQELEQERSKVSALLGSDSKKSGSKKQ
ncbi:G kinase-anchoring protein 1-like [Artemia franciscana]|uniref:G kinase-anchoring protein 1 n=1 Tax=Artemia franciscana TaxID=6661 RepID=A0AA88H9F7_ARTSF|nr:hypothetical protein QYM36_017005 [Artemia franciscana]